MYMIARPVLLESGTSINVIYGCSHVWTSFMDAPDVIYRWPLILTLKYVHVLYINVQLEHHFQASINSSVAECPTSNWTVPGSIPGSGESI